MFPAFVLLAEFENCRKKVADTRQSSTKHEHNLCKLDESSVNDCLLAVRACIYLLSSNKLSLYGQNIWQTKIPRLTRNGAFKNACISSSILTVILLQK